MLVKALIRAIRENSDANKPMAVVTLETTHPLEIVEIRLFKNAYNDGTVGKFKQMIGLECDIPLQSEIYNGKLSYNVPFGETIQVPARQPVKAAVGQ